MHGLLNHSAGIFGSSLIDLPIGRLTSVANGGQCESFMQDVSHLMPGDRQSSWCRSLSGRSSLQLQHRDALERFRETARSWLFELPDFSFLNGKPLDEYLLRLGELLRSPEPITWDVVDIMEMRFKKLQRFYTGSRDSDCLGCEVVEASGGGFGQCEHGQLFWW